jgi:outer membrane protein OmpA-like peptidoglycan-associated protein
VEVALVSAVMALILLLHGASTREVVIVLPDAQGRVGTVVVESRGERIVLDQPYATSRITYDGTVRNEPAPEPKAIAAVQAVFQPVLTALPERPRSFLLYFVTGTDVLTDESKMELQRMFDELKKRPVSDVVVIGHTDRAGDELANDQLSLQRAERLKVDLVGQGIPADVIRAAGRGEREPVIPTEDGVDEPQNRRVEISVR